jgi:hypothetical protein
VNKNKGVVMKWKTYEADRNGYNEHRRIRVPGRDDKNGKVWVCFMSNKKIKQQYILVDNDLDMVSMKPLEDRKIPYSTLKEAESDAEWLAEHNGTKVHIYKLVKTARR